MLKSSRFIIHNCITVTGPVSSAFRQGSGSGQDAGHHQLLHRFPHSPITTNRRNTGDSWSYTGEKDGGHTLPVQRGSGNHSGYFIVSIKNKLCVNFKSTYHLTRLEQHIASICVQKKNLVNCYALWPSFLIQQMLAVLWIIKYCLNIRMPYTLCMMDHCFMCFCGTTLLDMMIPILTDADLKSFLNPPRHT